MRIAVVFIVLLSACFAESQTLPKPEIQAVATHTGQAVSSPEAIRAKYSATVIVHMWIDDKGRVTRAVPMRELGLGLDAQAVKAAMDYRFKPAKTGGKPVASELWVQIAFENR